MSQSTATKESQTKNDQVNAHANDRAVSYSISDLAEYFQRSITWVKERKNDLKDIWLGYEDEMFTNTSSLTQRGFERFKDLYEKTSTLKLEKKGKKLVNVRTQPAMTLAEYKTHVQELHQIDPDSFGDDVSEGTVATQSASNSPRQVDEENEVINGELVRLEPTDITNRADEEEEKERESYEKTQIVLSNARTFFKEDFKEILRPIGLVMKEEFVNMGREMLNEGVVEISDIAKNMVQSAAPKTAKKSRKSQP